MAMKRQNRSYHLITSYTLSLLLLLSSLLLIYSFYISSIYGVIQESSTRLKKIQQRYIAIKYTFLYTGDVALQKELTQLYQRSTKLQREHLSHTYIYKPQSIELMDTRLFTLIQTTQEYKEKLEMIFKLKKSLGVDHTKGLYGSLRNSIHQVEDIFLEHQNSIELSFNMLKLRRHEKDFMLRGVKKYIDRFDDDYNRLVQLIEDSNISNKTTLKYNLRSYYQEFHAFCDIYRQLYKQNGLISRTQKIEKRFNVNYDQFIVDITDAKRPMERTMEYAIFVTLLLLIALIVTILMMRREIILTNTINTTS